MPKQTPGINRYHNADTVSIMGDFSYVSRLTIVSREAKKKQAVRDE